MSTKVVNVKKEPCDVYIGRGSRWGNPFRMLTEPDRESVVVKYRQYLYNQIQSGEVTIEELMSLSGKRLGCYCAPKACHGDVIVSAIEYYAKLEKESEHARNL